MGKKTPEIILRIVERGDPTLLQVFALRYAVFSTEQKVIPEVELDEEDRTATHCAALWGDEVVGTLRILARGEYTKIGRVAVARRWRRHGIGRLLMGFAHEEIRLHFAPTVVLHAQTAVRAFYEGLGYRVEGAEFAEDGIPHVAMRLTLTP